MQKHITKDGKDFVIRTPEENDAESILQFAKMLFASTDQVLTTPEEFTLTVEDEKAWINSFSNNPNAIALIATFDNKVIGLLFFAAQTRKKIAHTGEFGVSVHPGYQAKGIGRALIESLISWANNNSQVEKVCLQVLATNTPAIRLYQALGFIEEGRHVKALKQKNGTYCDIIHMYLFTS